MQFHVNVPRTNADGYLDGSGRVRMYESIIAQHAPERPLRVLELGVFSAGLSNHLLTTLKDRIDTYTGVDPYLGDDTDMYFHNYWKSDRSVAEQTYQSSKRKLESLGAELIRARSDEFLSATQARYDVIIVDGDHREAAALADLQGSWKRLEPGGLLLCDDFGNPDHPGVTRAATIFDRQISATRQDFGVEFTFFQKKGTRDLPFPLGVLWWRR